MQAKDPSPNKEHPFGNENPSIAYGRVWFNIMRIHRKFHPIMVKALRDEGISDPIWYEILLKTEQAGVNGQPMGALEDQLFVPQYALSRHIGRLEQAGFLRREVIADGRRKQILFLTEKGQGVHSRVWPLYNQAIQQEIGALLTTDEAYAMAQLMIKLLP